LPINKNQVSLWHTRLLAKSKKKLKDPNLMKKTRSLYGNKKIIWLGLHLKSKIFANVIDESIDKALIIQKNSKETKKNIIYIIQI
jgi:hypothetical protein